MIHFNNIKTHATDFPKTWSFLGRPEDADGISEAHKDQIHFLNDEASEFIRNYIHNSKMITGPVWDPFNKKYFKKIESFEVSRNDGKALKKWLFSKSIPFDKDVYMDFDESGQSVVMTWKMVIKYWEGLFFANDFVIFDESLNWGLFYFHEDKLFFATDKIYDKELEYEKTLEASELKNKYFNKDNLNFTKEEKNQALKAFKEKYNTDTIE